MKRKQSDPIHDKLFELASNLLDVANGPASNDQFKLDVLKQVASLYIGHVRATKNMPIDDDDTVTLEKLIQGIES